VNRRTGFTLVELLIVVTILVALVGLLLPALHGAIARSQAAVCASNIRQLALSNTQYAADSKLHYVRAAPDIFIGYGGRKRWHGERLATGVSSDPDQNVFDPARSPLAPYLGEAGRVKACPAFVDFTRDGALNAFEAGTGGYGYNHTYIGARNDLHGYSPASAAASAAVTDPARAGETVMFTDAAFTVAVSGQLRHIEYSFAEPTFFHSAPGAPSSIRPRPSIHFRHLDRTNIAWADNHVSDAPIAFNHDSIASGDPVDPAASNPLGWFGPEDSNALFDLH